MAASSILSPHFVCACVFVSLRERESLFTNKSLTVCGCVCVLCGVVLEDLHLPADFSTLKRFDAWKSVFKGNPLRKIPVKLLGNPPFSLH